VLLVSWEEEGWHGVTESMGSWLEQDAFME